MTNVLLAFCQAKHTALHTQQLPFTNYHRAFLFFFQQKKEVFVAFSLFLNEQRSSETTKVQEIIELILRFPCCRSRTHIRKTCRSSSKQRCKHQSELT